MEQTQTRYRVLHGGITRNGAKTDLPLQEQGSVFSLLPEEELDVERLIRVSAIEVVSEEAVQYRVLADVLPGVGCADVVGGHLPDKPRGTVFTPHEDEEVHVPQWLQSSLIEIAEGGQS